MGVFQIFGKGEKIGQNSPEQEVPNETLTETEKSRNDGEG
jgi:hypothetical protein